MSEQIGNIAKSSQESHQGIEDLDSFNAQFCVDNEPAIENLLVTIESTYGLDRPAAIRFLLGDADPN